MIMRQAKSDWSSAIREAYLLASMVPNDFVESCTTGLQYRMISRNLVLARARSVLFRPTVFMLSFIGHIVPFSPGHLIRRIDVVTVIIGDRKMLDHAFPIRSSRPRSHVLPKAQCLPIRKDILLT